MKFVTRIFSLFIVASTVSSAYAYSGASCDLKEMVVSMCESNEHLNDIISPKNINDVMRALELLETEEGLTDADKTNEVIRRFFNELLKAYDEKIEELTKNENFFKNIGILGFWGSAMLAVFCAYDHLPHVSNEFIEHHLHSRDTHVYALIALGVTVFGLFYKSQGYQNEKVAMQDIVQRITHLKESLTA